MAFPKRGCCHWLLLLSGAAADDLLLFRSAFSVEECERIASIFLARPPEHDTRTIPLLPNMEDEFRVSRVSRFDDGSLMEQGQLDFIYDRLASLQQDAPPSQLLAIGGLQNVSSSLLKARVGFNMIHEFEFDSASDATPQFDWHADTKPGDGKRRSLNINVMLSKPDSDFGGGELDVGANRIGAQQGDMYLYPAGVVHRVRPLDFGRRLTLIIALQEVEASESPEEEAAAIRERRVSYWSWVEASFERLVKGALAGVSKVHILHGEFLEGAGRADEARAAFCRAYIATGPETAAEHVQRFVHDGMAALQQPEGANLQAAEQYFSMARCIAPGHEEASHWLGAVREALALVAEREANGGSAAPADVNAGHDEL